MRKTLEVLFQVNIGCKPEFKVTWVNQPTVGEDWSEGRERFLAVDVLWFCVQVGWFDSDPLEKGEVR